MTGAFATVLARYPQPIRGLDWKRLAESGGLSGAAIWRGDRAVQPLFYAKSYPAGTDPLDTSMRHRWCEVAVRDGLPFIASLIRTAEGSTLTMSENRCWEIGSWMPGEADFVRRPSREKLIAACDAVASLHTAWRDLETRCEVPRAVRSRLALLAQWKANPLSGSMLAPGLEARARGAIASHFDAARSRLQPWADRKLTCRICVRDLRHDHFLFTGDRLTGLIDYGAAACDTPATDAARMLGELVDDAGLYEIGLAQLVEAWGTDVCPPQLVRDLDHAGVVGSVIHWMMRLRRERGTGASKAEIETRLMRLIARLESGMFAGLRRGGRTGVPPVAGRSRGRTGVPPVAG